jgi:hypothetical protein
LIVTEELLQQGMRDRGGWSRFQFGLLKVSWPLKSGWKYDVIGKEIPDNVGRAFVATKGLWFHRPEHIKHALAAAEARLIEDLWAGKDVPLERPFIPATSPMPRKIQKAMRQQRFERTGYYGEISSDDD